MLCRVCSNAWLHVIEEGGTHPGIFSRFRTYVRHMTGGGRLHVRYARCMWPTNGVRIRICLVVLSNFHVQSILIRATVYFILNLKDLNKFWNYLIN
jgi:hypothetical protein